ncbi:MAG: hypothetical protein ACHQQQ_09515 [Bacteroidota bacterium]
MIRKPGKEIPALYGGIIIALITNTPGLNVLNYCLCCGGIMLGGFLAVLFYKNDFTPETPPMVSNDCLIVGGLAGMVGACIGTVLWSIILAIFGNYMVEFLHRWLSQMGSQGVPQYYIDLLEQARSMRLTIFGFFLELLKNVIIDIIFGGLGGLIGYQLFKPRYPYYPPPPQQPPPMA